MGVGRSPEVAETGLSVMAGTAFSEANVVTQGKVGKMGEQNQHPTSPSATPDTLLQPLRKLAGSTCRQVFSTYSRD
ncbi:hypothetical protein E2C01_047423 [Portunus trituberculatus]|uniref:Uncharacterized protein n=1 Tax=Portunus trituberculatus TaxID=210409 RepID=A0A5B7G0D9_PORTR|nr:hypothetical protein [Portunus trituberculatus]